MTNFNGINPIESIINYIIAAKKQNADNTCTPQNVQNSQGANPSSQLIQNLSTNTFSKLPANYLNTSNISTNENIAINEMLKMDNEVVQKYLLSLLDMPESLDKFLEYSNTKNNVKEGLRFLKIFTENMLSNKELSALFNKNSNDAVQKVLNIVTQTIKNGSDPAQLKEILSTLNSIHASSTTNTNSLRELFLLYIPIDYQIYKENNNFETFASDNETKIKEGTLSILFETYSFSNILAVINSDEDIISLQIYAQEGFPYEKFKKIISISAKEKSINILCDYIAIKEYKTKNKKQDFKIISQNLVPISVLNISNIIIKAIFKLDCDMHNNV